MVHNGQVHVVLLGGVRDKGPLPSSMGIKEGVLGWLGEGCIPNRTPPPPWGCGPVFFVLGNLVGTLSVRNIEIYLFSGAGSN